MSDDYEGDFSTRRALIYTLRFTAKTYLFGPISTASSDIIKKVSVGFVAGHKTDTPSRDLVYSVERRATKDYTGEVTTTLSTNISEIDTILEVTDATNIPENSYIYIDEEEIFVDSKSGNKLTVIRGADNTTAAEHVSGTGVKKITQEDNQLIEVGDDFGFSGSLS
jgi:hypothetical protein